MDFRRTTAHSDPCFPSSQDLDDDIRPEARCGQALAPPERIPPIPPHTPDLDRCWSRHMLHKSSQQAMVPTVGSMLLHRLKMQPYHGYNPSIGSMLLLYAWVVKDIDRRRPTR